MSLSRQEIIDYASLYVEAGEVVDFPMDGDLFCLIGRDLPEGKTLTEEEGWGFQGYGICLGYNLDYEEKPLGKWLWMRFASLASFPPTEQTLKLQPPHIAKGRFQNPGRTNEFRILKISLTKAAESTDAPTDSAGSIAPGASQPASSTDAPDTKGNIVQFRSNKKSKS
jgi:hypothetical protein